MSRGSRRPASMALWMVRRVSVSVRPICSAVDSNARSTSAWSRWPAATSWAML